MDKKILKRAIEEEIDDTMLVERLTNKLWHMIVTQRDSIYVVSVTALHPDVMRRVAKALEQKV